MIVVEGPDGGGKSTLATRLMVDLGLPLHERAVKDVTGPDERDLWGWTCRDVLTWDVQPLSIYDRHPLVSEYIYGPIIRKRVPSGFLHPSSRGMMKRFQARSLVIFAIPDLDIVRLNMEAEQMDGVVENIERIHSTYQVTRANWDGWAVDYDYRATVLGQKGSYESVLRAARVHIATWKA